MLPKIEIPEYDYDLGYPCCSLSCPFHYGHLSRCNMGWATNYAPNGEMASSFDSTFPCPNCPGPGSYRLIKDEQIEGLLNNCLTDYLISRPAPISFDQSWCQEVQIIDVEKFKQNVAALLGEKGRK